MCGGLTKLGGAICCINLRPEWSYRQTWYFHVLCSQGRHILPKPKDLCHIINNHVFYCSPHCCKHICRCHIILTDAHHCERNPCVLLRYLKCFPQMLSFPVGESCWIAHVTHLLCAVSDPSSSCFGQWDSFFGWFKALRSNVHLDYPHYYKTQMLGRKVLLCSQHTLSISDCINLRSESKVAADSENTYSHKHKTRIMKDSSL